MTLRAYPEGADGISPEVGYAIIVDVLGYLLFNMTTPAPLSCLESDFNKGCHANLGPRSVCRGCGCEFCVSRPPGFTLLISIVGFSRSFTAPAVTFVPPTRSRTTVTRWPRIRPMKIHADSDLVGSASKVLANVVNTRGVVGKGIVLRLRQIYPEMRRQYWEHYEQRCLTIGKFFSLLGITQVGSQLSCRGALTGTVPTRAH